MRRARASSKEQLAPSAVMPTAKNCRCSEWKYQDSKPWQCPSGHLSPCCSPGEPPSTEPQLPWVVRSFCSRTSFPCTASTASAQPHSPSSDAVGPPTQAPQARILLQTCSPFSPNTTTLRLSNKPGRGRYPSSCQDSSSSPPSPPSSRPSISSRGSPPQFCIPPTPILRFSSAKSVGCTSSARRYSCGP